MKTNFKISKFSRFCWGVSTLLRSKFENEQRLLNSVPFIKKIVVNQVYFRIRSSWLTFTVLQWMKRNSRISQFSGFLVRSGYVISVKIWKWLKLLHFVPFHFDWLSQLWSEWRQTSKLVNLKISAKVLYAILVKIWKWLKLLNFVPFIKKRLVNHVYIRIWSFWLTFTVLQWIKKTKIISVFSSFLLRSGYAI